ncbi:MAG: GDSL-type esterase/lipase family protein [Candidatus Rokuibacteriota bacterium]
MIDSVTGSPSTRPARSGVAKTLLCATVVLVGIGFGALAFEVAVRAAVPVGDFFYEFDPRVGLKGIPNKHGRAIRRGIFDTPVEINSHGFRDREHTYDKSAGTRRVVLLGDSFIEALQVPFERSVTPLLEDRIRRVNGAVEFINLGLSGFGTGRQYLMLREYGLRYQPDLVVLFFVGNDISDNSRRLQGKPFVPYPLPAPNGSLARDERGQPRFSPFADRTSRLGAVATFLRNHSKGYRALREAIDSSASLNGLLYRVGLMTTPPEQVNRPSADNFGFYEIYRLNPTPVWAEAWALTEGMLVATRDLAAAHGARFAVVLVPSAWEVYPELWEGILRRIPAMRDVPMDLELPSRRLGAFLAAHRIPYVSLLTEFRARAGKLPLLYVAGDAHWTADGHRLAADLLAGHVTSLMTAAGGAMVRADVAARSDGAHR